MQLDLTAQYGRLDNILYQDGVQIVKFTFSKFCDWDILSEDGVKYMERYINGYMDRNYFEILPGYYQLYQSQDIKVDVMTFIEDIAIDSMDFHELIVEKIENQQEIITIEQVGEISHDPESSRKDQVAFWMRQGLSSASQIAKKIDANPSYVQRLIKQVKDENS